MTDIKKLRVGEGIQQRTSLIVFPQTLKLRETCNYYYLFSSTARTHGSQDTMKGEAESGEVISI